MEKEFITADWLREQGFTETDFDDKHFKKQIGERIMDIHQNNISLAWTFACFSDEKWRAAGFRYNSGTGLRYQGELKNLAPSFF